MLHIPLHSRYAALVGNGGYTWADLPGSTFLPAGPWRAVSGGDLPAPVMVRFHRHADGRYVVTGLLIGEESGPREVTSQTLRQIRLGNLVADAFADFDPDSPQDWPRAAMQVIAGVNADAGGHVATGPSRGPGEEKLRDFARTYQIELARHPRRAMSAAAAAHSISRATANRWAAMCRQLGYLPGGPPAAD